MKPAALYETGLAQIRGKMKKLGLTPDSVREAIKWARGKSCAGCSAPTW